MLVRGWLLLLFTLVQGEHRKYPASWPLWTQEEKNKPWRRKETLRSPSCEKLWLAGWPVAPHLHSSASGSLVNTGSRSSHHILASVEQRRGQVPRSPNPLACSWALCSTLDYTICKTSVRVHWGQSAWWWRKSREAYFYRETVPLRVQCCHFRQKERNTEEVGLFGGGTCRGVNLYEITTAQSCSNTIANKSESSFNSIWLDNSNR